VTRDRQSGLTVFELLIALVLLAMIGTILASTISTGARVWERSKSFPTADKTASLRLELRRWIEAAKPPQMPIGLKQEIVATPEKFQFLTTAFFDSHPPETEGRATITLARIDQGNRTQIEITLDALDPSGAVAQTDTWIVAELVGSARLRYYQRSTNLDDGAWVETWAAPRILPALVSLDFETPTRDWPKFTVRPRL